MLGTVRDGSVALGNGRVQIFGPSRSRDVFDIEFDQARVGTAQRQNASQLLTGLRNAFAIPPRRAD